MDCRANADIGRAATQIRYLPIDICIAWIRVSAEQRYRRHDHAGLAITALRHVELGPRLLYGVLAVAREALDRRDVAALRHHDRHDASAHGYALDVHGAGAAQ